MRTTVNISDELLTKAKAVSLRKKVPLGEVIDDALRHAFGKERKPASRKIKPLKTYRGEGVQPGVNLNCGSELLDLMEK